MSTPHFSVIIPAYNAASTLARALDSVLAQTWPAFEIIVIDDGSIDATAEVAASYGDKIRYLRQDNSGVSATRNHGASIASGDWLAFLDADDWYYPDRLKWHGEWIARDSTLDFLTGDYEYRDTSGGLLGSSMQSKVSGRAMLAKAAGGREVVMTFEDLELFVADHFGDTHTLSVPRKRFLDLGGYPTGYRVCEDVWFLTKLSAISQRIGVVCVPMAAYIIHNASATRHDPLRAQVDNVHTLVNLAAVAKAYPEAIRRGVRSRLRYGRLNLGYAQVRAGKKLDAVSTVLPTLWESPGDAGLRDLISMVRG